MGLANASSQKRTTSVAKYAPVVKVSRNEASG